MDSRKPPTIEQLFDQLPPHVARVLCVLMRTLVWGLLFVVLYILRSFFLLIFLTFVFSYLLSRSERWLTPWIRRRGVRVTTVGVGFLAVLIGIGFFIVPSVVQQARVFAENYPDYIAATDSQLITLRKSHSLLRSALPAEYLKAPGGTPTIESSPTLMLAHEILGLDSLVAGGDNEQSFITVFRNIGAKLLAIGSTFLLSLLFSFLIVVDLPGLSRSVSGLASSRVGFIYEEVGSSVKQFTAVLGHTLHAQFLIAVINTILTAGIILLLGIGSKLAFLSLIVFVCGFIPVAGVFISSVPICLLVLQHSGISGVFLAILLIWIIHLIEAYVLNPRIFGSRLHINPVLVLIILTVAGKLFNLWGLILGLPVCTYVFQYAIRNEAALPQKQELETA